MPIEELLKMYGQTGPASETTSAEASSLPETEEEKESGRCAVCRHCNISFQAKQCRVSPIQLRACFH